MLGRIFSPKFCSKKVAPGRSANRVGVISFDPLLFVRLRHRSSRALCNGMLSGRVLSEAEGGPGCCVCVSVSFFACWYLDVALHVGILMLGCVYIPPMAFLFLNFPFDKLI